jgi:hypothetical protein
MKKFIIIIGALILTVCSYGQHYESPQKRIERQKANLRHVARVEMYNTMRSYMRHLEERGEEYSTFIDTMITISYKEIDGSLKAVSDTSAWENTSNITISPTFEGYYEWLGNNLYPQRDTMKN